jgi:site-specific recombinase XerD
MLATVIYQPDLEIAPLESAMVDVATSDYQGGGSSIAESGAGGQLVPPAENSDGRPSLARVKALVLDSLGSPHSRRSYDLALTRFLTWSAEAREPFSKALVQRYGRQLADSGLSAGTVNVHLSAIRRLAAEAADNGLLAPELAAGIARVKGEKTAGVRTGTWLTREQAEQLLNFPDASTLKGVRDRAILALLIGAGLRRDELSRLDCTNVQQRDGRWVLVDIRGKGNKIRTVPVAGWVKVALDAWLARSGIVEGGVVRSLSVKGELQNRSLLGQNILDVVAEAGRRIGIPKLAPHDLRRTFAKLAHNGAAPLEQIQLSLGHASIQTTERYLGVKQSLSDAPCDHLGLKGPIDAV